MLELINVSFEVAGENGGRSKEIIKNLSMTAERGSFVVITGPNGGGKSTLAKLIMGIEKPTGGKILFQGEDITDKSVTERAHMGIGFAFQQPIRFKGIYVRDILSLAAGKALTTEAACEYLSEVGLCAIDYIDREINASLSGGELKRIEIATLIARGTPLSIFDEPEAGIDLWSFHNLIRVFERIRAERSGSVIIISHQERILDIADKVVVVSGGGISASGPKDKILPELLADSNICRYYREEI